MNEFFTRFAPPPKPTMRFEEPSLTEQCHKDDCDINKIIDRFNRTGDISVLSTMQVKQGFYADVTGAASSFMELQAKVAEGKSIFESLPSEIRSKFGNNAAVFWDFVSDPKNQEECIKLGLLEKTETDVSGRDSSLLDRTVTTDTERSEVAIDRAKE